MQEGESLNMADICSIYDHNVKWPVLMTNKFLLGITGFWWGGKEPYLLHASDCVAAQSEQLGSWVPSIDSKIEPIWALFQAPYSSTLGRGMLGTRSESSEQL